LAPCCLPLWRDRGDVYPLIRPPGGGDWSSAWQRLWRDSWQHLGRAGGAARFTSCDAGLGLLLSPASRHDCGRGCHRPREEPPLPSTLRPPSRPLGEDGCLRAASCPPGFPRGRGTCCHVCVPAVGVGLVRLWGLWSESWHLAAMKSSMPRPLPGVK
jgi:hypothetical protein